MNRERDAWNKMKDSAQERFEPAEVYDVTPLPKPKANYLSATLWTAVVATLVCSIFMGLLLYVVNESNIEGNLTKAVSQAISGLKQSVNQQNNEIQNLRAENKKIHEYLKLWTPINNRLPPGVEERWKIKGYGLPTYELQSQNTCREITQCLPLFQ
jgi:hypothetical protein